VKIYEGANGEGPLVAALHGDGLPADITIYSPSVFITFKSDHTGSAKGFKATYTVNN